MVELYWPGPTTFLGRDQQYSESGVHDVPDELEEKFRDRGWEDPPDADAATSDGDEEGGRDDLQSLIGADRETLEAADYSRLRQAATSNDIDGVDGRSSKAEIIDVLADE